MKIRATLRWQLQLYYFLVLFVTLAILTGLSIHWMQQSERFKYDSRMRDLQRILLPVLTGLHRTDTNILSKAPENHLLGPRYPGPRPPGPRPPRRGRERTDDLRKLMDEGWYFAAWSKQGGLVSASLNFPGSIDPENFPKRLREAQVRDYNDYRQLISETPREYILIAYPLSLLQADTQKRAWIIIGINLVLLIAATSVGWWLIGRALRPLKDIEQTANDIAKGQLSRRIKATSSPNEISELSENLNQTFRQLEAMFERQTRFTSDASHELRTPIAVILNHCQYGLAKERTSEEYRDALSACERAGERMKNLTTGLLELSKLESGEIHLELAACSLGEIAEEALELVEPLALDKGLLLKAEIQDVTIRANGDRLWQVLVNLLNNAIRHTPSGKAVSLRTEQLEKQVKITVLDQGEGISEEALPHLFERFYRVDSSRARSQQEGGFGLGLAICETIVKAHRGTIQVQSRPGHETRFEIFLPHPS